jgi:hypothetical protein
MFTSIVFVSMVIPPGKMVPLYLLFYDFLWADATTARPFLPKICCYCDNGHTIAENGQKDLLMPRV